MVKCLGFAALFLAAGAALAADRAPKIGEPVGELRFKDIRGQQRSLRDAGSKKAYVLVFTTTQCPLVRRYLPKLVSLDAKFSELGVQVLAVNVGADDSIRDMASQALEFDAAFPFVKDSDLSCAQATGVTRTPEAVVLDAGRRLVYRGRIDDQYRLGGTRPDATRNDLEEAVADVLAGRAVRVPETAADGCKITPPAPIDASQPKPTYHKDVAPIVQHRCAGCHRPETGAPFSLLSYSDVSTQAEMLAEVVLDRRMPPWYASPRHGKFQNDPSLTKAEIRTLVNWVRTGRSEGNPAEAPPPPKFPESKWKIGEPDLVISELVSHDVAGTGYLPYRNIVLPYVFLNETWVEAFEIKPDNPSVVHHCNMAYATSEGAGEETFLTGYVPGGQPMDLGRFDNGVAASLPRFSVLGLQIHYTTTGKPERCKISVGLRFPKRTVRKKVQHILLDTHRLRIPPHHGAFAVRSESTLDHDIDLLGMFTHMHLRGKDMTFFAHLPGKPRETLLEIPNYNFEWQLGYEFAPGQKQLPKGTRIEAVAHYDNSPFNPFNPDPSRTVPWGQQTYDEMFNGFVFFVDSHEDLNLAVDPRTGRKK